MHSDLKITAMLILLRDFKMEDGKAVIPLGITVQGDVLIVIYHARSTLGGRLQAKVIIKLGISALASSENVVGHFRTELCSYQLVGFFFPF